MNLLRNLIERCHERHENPLRQRQTLIKPAIYNKGIPYEYTVYCAHRYAVTLHALEEASISFMPIGRAPENDRGPRALGSKWYRRFSKRQVTGSWEPRRWRESWGIQVYTGIPSERYGARWHDINFTYQAICTAPDAIITCIEALADAVVNPLLTMSKSGGLRFSCRIPDYLHPKIEKERLYICKHTSDKQAVYLEILGEEGYNRWDARYEILMGDLLDPPIISRDILFAPIDVLRDVLHETIPSMEKKQISTLSKAEYKKNYTTTPFSLGTRRLDLAREAFVRRGFSYIHENNGIHQWTLNLVEDRNKNVSLWERDGTVWIQASVPDFGLPIEAKPITDVWDDTGILLPSPPGGIPLSDDFLAVQQGKLSPLAIKRSKPLIREQGDTTKSYGILTKDTFQMQRLFKGNTRILGLITETGAEEDSQIASYLPEGSTICFNASTIEQSEEVERLFKNRNLPNTRWKSRMHLWEQVKDMPIDKRMANPFKHGNVCEDPERCDALEEKGGDPSESICPQCPVYTECQQHGYLSQSTTLRRANRQILTNPQMFFNPQYAEAIKEIFKQSDETERFCIVDESKGHDLFLKCELSIKMLKDWVVNWQGEPLGNFANFLLNALELKGRFYDDSVRRIRSAVQAFQRQGEVIVRQMCQVNIRGRVVEQGFVDSETGQQLARFHIKFEGGANAYMPLDNNDANILKTKQLPFSSLRSFVVNEDMKIPMSMTQAIRLGILNTETVESIQTFPTVCPNPNWTVWHQLKRFFQHYTRNEDARVRWDGRALEFWIPPMLHPSVKRLLITTPILHEQHLNRIFPDEVIKFRYLEPTPWKKENRVFQIRTGLYPRETILAYNGNWDVLGISEIGQHFFAGILAEIKKDSSVSHAVITYAGAIRQLKEIVDRENVYFLKHFKNIQDFENIDEWDAVLEKAQVIWIVGAPEPPQGNIWRHAQILFGNDEQPLRYEKDIESGLYKDERLQGIYEQNIAFLLRSAVNCAALDRSSGKTVVLFSGLALPGFTDRPETLLFDWEDFEVADGLDGLPKVIATRQRFETERANLTAKSSREKVEEVLGCSSRQANRFLQKLRGGAPLRVPFRTQILSLLADGKKKTTELVSAIEGNPEAVKNELTRLVDKGEIVRVQRGVYDIPPRNQ